MDSVWGLKEGMLTFRPINFITWGKASQFTTAVSEPWQSLRERAERRGEHWSLGLNWILGVWWKRSVTDPCWFIWGPKDECWPMCLKDTSSKIRGPTGTSLPWAHGRDVYFFPLLLSPGNDSCYEDRGWRIHRWEYDTSFFILAPS